MRKTRILIVNSPSLAQIIRHIVRDRSDFEVADVTATARGVSRAAKDLLPDVIVANVRPVEAGVRELVASLRRYDPRSKIILACPQHEFLGAAAKCGADVCVEQERLVLRLVPTILTLTGGRRREAARVHRRSHQTSPARSQFIRSGE